MIIAYDNTEVSFLFDSEPDSSMVDIGMSFQASSI